jgi:hypothetical protein
MGLQLLGLTVAVGVALAVAGAGVVFPLAPAPTVVETTKTVTVVGPHTPSGASVMPSSSVSPTVTGTVEVRGGTVSLSGLRGVFGAGEVPAGDYTVTASPHGGQQIDLGPVRVLEGGILQVKCSFGVCSLEASSD